MKITITLNGKRIQEEIANDVLLIDFLRAHGCYQRQTRLRNKQLRALYGLDGSKAGIILFPVMCKMRWSQHHDLGRRTKTGRSICLFHGT